MRIISVIVAALLSFPFSAWADAQRLPQDATGTYMLDKSHAAIIFKLKHLGFSNYVGRFNGFDATLQLDAANPAKSSVEATITPASVDTNNSELQDILRGENYFNIAQFPEAKLVSKQIKLTGANRGLMLADFTMLGVTKPVTLDITFNQVGMNPYSSKYTIGFTATGTLRRSDWGMKTLVPQVADDVQILVEAEFNRKD